MKYIIALMGPSQSGKSFVINRILANANEKFHPKLIAKQTTRPLRTNELEALQRGLEIDVEHVAEITADLAYQTYGKRTGVSVDKLINYADKGYVPVVVINDINAMAKLKKECRKRDSQLCVLSIFLFRRIPVRDQFIEEDDKRGNVETDETEQRFLKAATVYRIYIENIHMFDYVMLNTINYENVEILHDTIVDRQICAIRDNIIAKNKFPSARKSKNKPVIYVVSGNGASGKDELIEATNALGKLYADVLPKYTSRNQRKDDGSELICKNNITSDNKFISNIEYQHYIKNKALNPTQYLIYYGNNNTYEYAIDLKMLNAKLKEGRSVVIALSDIATISALKKIYPDQVITIYCNSQISKEEFLKVNELEDSDGVVKNKGEAFEEQQETFIDNYLAYRHVIIYAENELGHASDARQEELIDQLFRIFRAYEDKIL